MRIHIFIAIIIFLCFHSCSSPEGDLEGIFIESDGVIKLPSKINYKKEIKLTELLSSLEVIPLEVSSESMIAQIQKIFFNDNKIIIFDNLLERITIFDRHGHFLNTINEKGRGPGEFMMITDVYVDFINEHIIVNDKSLLKVLFFELNGEFVKEKNISVIADDIIVDFFGNIILHRNNHFPIDYTFEGQEMNIAILDGTNFEIINEYYSVNPKFRHWRPRSLSTFSKNHQDSTILFVNFFDYNIYNITKDDFSVKYSVNPTDNNTKFNEIFHDTPMPGEASRRLANTNTLRWLSSIYENEKYIYFQFFDTEFRNVLVDKKSDRTIVYTRIKNDIADHNIHRVLFGMVGNKVILMGDHINESDVLSKYGDCCLHNSRYLNNTREDLENPVILIGKLDVTNSVFY